MVDVGATPPGDLAAVFDGGRPVVVGHRGARRAAPENTPAAFAEAARQGADWVEFDVRLSADGVAVVVHDAEIEDGTPVCEVESTALEAAGIHRLDAVLPALPEGLGADVEIKHRRGEPGWDADATVGRVTAAVLAPLLDRRPLLVTSFDPAVLEVVVSFVPVPTGLLTGVLTSLGTCSDRARELGCAVVAPHFTAPGLSAEGVGEVHDAGLQVLVWTVNSAWRTRRLAAADVDAICSDDVAGTVAVLDAAPSSGADGQS